MKKELNYRLIKGRAKCHEIRFTSMGLKFSRTFYNYDEAVAFRLRLAKVYDQMNTALKYMEAENYKVRLSQTDTVLLDEATIDWTDLEGLRQKVIWIDAASRPQTEYEANLNPTISQIISAYLSSRKKEGNPVTENCMTPYRFWFSESKISNLPCKSLGVKMLDNELKRLSAEGRSPATINTYRIALSGAWTLMAQREGMNIEHIPRKAQKYKVDSEHTMAYNQVEVDLIVAKLYEEDERMTFRNKSKGADEVESFVLAGPLAELASLTAIRKTFLSELTVMQVRDLDGESPFIYKGMKGGKIVRVPLTRRAVEICKRLVAGSKNGWLFHNNGTPPLVKTFRRLYRIIRTLEGVRHTPKPFHSFRAHCATKMYEKGATSLMVSRFLGCTVGVAEGYIAQTKTSDDSMRNFFEADKPSSHLTLVPSDS